MAKEKQKPKKRSTGGPSVIPRLMAGAAGAALAVGGATIGADRAEVDTTTAAGVMAAIGILGAVATKGKTRDAAIGLALGGAAVYGFKKMSEDDGAERNSGKPSQELAEAVRDVIAEEERRRIGDRPSQPDQVPNLRTIRAA